MGFTLLTNLVLLHIKKRNVGCVQFFCRTNPSYRQFKASENCDHDNKDFHFLEGILPFLTHRTFRGGLVNIARVTTDPVRIRDGHADAVHVISCWLMRICANICFLSAHFLPFFLKNEPKCVKNR